MATSDTSRPVDTKSCQTVVLQLAPLHFVGSVSTRSTASPKVEEIVRTNMNLRSYEALTLLMPPAKIAFSFHDVHFAEPFISDFGNSIRYRCGLLRPTRVTNHMRLASCPCVSTTTAPGLASPCAGRFHSMTRAFGGLVVLVRITPADGDAAAVVLVSDVWAPAFSGARARVNAIHGNIPFDAACWRRRPRSKSAITYSPRMRVIWPPMLWRCRPLIQQPSCPGSTDCEFRRISSAPITCLDGQAL